MVAIVESSGGSPVRAIQSPAPIRIGWTRTLAFGSGTMNACAKAAARAGAAAGAAPRAFQRSAMFTYVFPDEAERAQRSPGLFVQPLRHGLRVGAVSELGPGWWG